MVYQRCEVTEGVINLGLKNQTLLTLIDFTVIKKDICGKDAVSQNYKISTISSLIFSLKLLLYGLFRCPLVRVFSASLISRF